MSTTARPNEGAEADQVDQPGFGLTTAIALIMGSIIGVGIFNLPTSLAGYGPITLVSMGLTTVGALALALLFAALSRRLPADGGPYAYARVAFGNRLGLRQRLVVLDHGVGRQRGDRRRLGALRRGVRQQGPQRGLARSCWCWSACGCRRSINLSRRQEHGRRPGRRRRSSSSPRWRSCRPSGCSTSTRANFTPWNVSGESAIGAIGGGMAIALFSYLGVETAVGRGRQGPRPRPQHPAGDDPRHARDRGRLHAVADRGVRDPADGAAGRRRRRRSPTRPTRCSAARGPAT